MRFTSRIVRTYVRARLLQYDTYIERGTVVRERSGAGSSVMRIAVRTFSSAVLTRDLKAPSSNSEVDIAFDLTSDERDERSALDSWDRSLASKSHLWAEWRGKRFRVMGRTMQERNAN